MIGKLSIVGTPIGNLEDISLRALRVLRDSDIILCEDTRITKKLLFKYEIENKVLWAYDEHTHDRVFPKIGEALMAGKNLSLVSDAGMPGVSDPGSYLIHTVRESLPDCTIDVIGGPTALTNAIAWSGIDTTNGFTFLGFAPHKKGRETMFKLITAEYKIRPIALYESSHRILKLAEWFSAHAPELSITICREMTKMHEELVIMKASELIEYLNLPNKQKGEFVVIFS